MKKKQSVFVSLLIVLAIAVVSFFVLRVLNQEITPDISVDVAEIGKKILQAVVDLVLSLINPEKKTFF